jgi:hypothetical protein
MNYSRSKWGYALKKVFREMVNIARVAWWVVGIQVVWMLLVLWALFGLEGLCALVAITSIPGSVGRVTIARALTVLMMRPNLNA